MTRINVGILPKELPSKLLLAELREIKRIPNTIHKSNTQNIPSEFSLGTGHVRFFYDKGKYTYQRYLDLYQEALSRGFNVTDFSGAWNNYPKELFNDWESNQEHRKILIERINQRGFLLI